MFQPQTIDIVYVGSKKFKPDNVCGTGTVWFGYGDVQKVERKHAPKFMAHPDVWMIADEFKKLNPDADSQKLTDSTDGLGGDAGSVDVDGGASGDAGSVGSAETAGLSDAAKVAPVADENKDDENSTSGKKGDELSVVKGAILSLEQGNPKHFSTTNGVPVVSAVRSAAGDENITAADVRAAWAELNGKAE